MNWKPNPGKPPRTGDKPLRVRFANGHESIHSYTAGQLRWSMTGSEWDVREVALVNGAKASSGSAWTPVSGGY